MVVNVNTNMYAGNGDGDGHGRAHESQSTEHCVTRSTDSETSSAFMAGHE